MIVMIRNTYGWFICLLLLSLSSAAQELNEKNWEINTLKSLARTRTPAQNSTFKFISDANVYMNYAVPGGLFLTGAINGDKQMRQNAAYIASSTALTALLNYGLKKVFKRDRPFKRYPEFVSVISPHQYSFPSGHSSSAFAMSTAVARAYPKWYIIAPAVIWGGSVAYSRMYLGVHYPTDVAAGAALGVGSAFGMNFIKP